MSKKRIVVEIEPELLKREFHCAHSNAIRRRLLEAEFARQLTHEAVRLALREYNKWYAGKESVLG